VADAAQDTTRPCAPSVIAPDGGGVVFQDFTNGEEVGDVGTTDPPPGDLVSPRLPKKPLEEVSELSRNPKLSS